MKKQIAVLATISLFCSANGYANVTFYCAPVDQIKITSDQGGMWPYQYSTPEDFVYPKNQPPGIQPSLMGWGDACKAYQLNSVVWTDGALACNYDGQNDQSQPEVLVMLSNPLGKSPTCNFPTNGGKTFCDSNNPYACPMVCKTG